MAKTKRGRKTQAARDYLAQNPNAPASEVVEALKQQGIKASPAVIYNLRSSAKKPSATAGRKPANAAASSNGAVDGGKSVAVRAAIRELGRKTPTKEIIDHLAGKGIEVSVALVAKVKSRMKPGRKSRPAMTAAAPAARSTDQTTYDHLLAVKKMADEFGGTDSLRRTLDVLDKLR